MNLHASKQTEALVCPLPGLASARTCAHAHPHRLFYKHIPAHTCPRHSRPASLPAPGWGPQGRFRPDGQLSLRSPRSQQAMLGHPSTRLSGGRGCAGGGEPPRGPRAASSLHLCPRSWGALQVPRCLTTSCHAAPLPLRGLSVPRPPAASPCRAWALGRGQRGG